MTDRAVNPDLDLVLNRVIRATRRSVWRAWTEPDLVAKWWLPAPMLARVDQLNVNPGGAFVTSRSEDGDEFVPHTDSIFLVVEAERRLVFTNAIDSAWRPAAPAPVAMTAEIVFEDHPEGTEYKVTVRHGDPAQRNLHEELGFFEGWGAVTEALAALAEAAS